MTFIIRFAFSITLSLVSLTHCAAQFPNSPTSQPSIDLKSDSISSNRVVERDTAEKVKFKLIKSILDKKYPNPNRAAAMSLVLPGSGQIYNKKIWKLPFVYGALGGLGYLIITSNEDYKTFSEAYLAVVDDDPLTENPFPNLSESSLLTLRDRFDKRRQQGYIFFALTWILNSVDAYVDAHLNSFDVSEDISMQINPAGIRLGDANGYGLSLQFTYQDNKHQYPTFIY